MKKAVNVLKSIWKLLTLYILITLTLSYAMFQGGFVSWFLLYSFLPFAFYSLALSFYPLKDLRVEREMPKTVYNAGDKLTIKIKIERTTPFPLHYLFIKDRLSERLASSLQKNNVRTFVFPWFRRKIDYSYVIDNLPRGEHYFQSVLLKTGDPFGLTEKQRSFPVTEKIIVYPAYEEIIYVPLENHYDQGTAISKERVQRDTSMAIGVREYQPGDKFSWINWKATAKRNDIMTKEFEQRNSNDAFLIMDCAREKEFEGIVSFTASIIKAMLQKGVQVGLLSSSRKRVLFPITGGKAHQQELFYHLATVTDTCPVTLDKVIEEEPALIQQNGAIMVITSQLSKSLIEKASYLCSGKGLITLFVIKNQQEPASSSDLSLKAFANGRGLRVVFVHKGHFSDAFSGVRRG